MARPPNTLESTSVQRLDFLHFQPPRFYERLHESGPSTPMRLRFLQVVLVRGFLRGLRRRSVWEDEDVVDAPLAIFEEDRRVLPRERSAAGDRSRGNGHPIRAVGFHFGFHDYYIGGGEVDRMDHRR